MQTKETTKHAGQRENRPREVTTNDRDGELCRAGPAYK